MEKKKSSHIIIKPTFEACLSSQERLRLKITELIDTNQPIQSEEERSEFIRLLAHSTLGLGTFKKFIIILDQTYHFGNVESTARWLAIQTQNKVIIPGDMQRANSPPYDIKFFWEKLLELLFSVYPEALQKSISMSREGESMPGRQDSYNITE